MPNIPRKLSFFLLLASVTSAPLGAQGIWDLFGDSIFDDPELWKMRGELTATYSISGWSPAPLDGANIETTGLNIAVAELNLVNGVFDRLFLPKLPSIRYEWTPGGDNDLQRGLQESLLEARGEESFTRLLAGTSLLGTLLGSTDNAFGSLDVDYEVFVFSSSIQLEEDKLYSPFGGGTVALSSGDEVTSITRFERYRASASVLFDIANEHVQRTLDIGPFYSTYQKPYSLTIEGVQDSSELLDTKFEGVGISLNYRTLRKISGEDKHGLFLDTLFGIDFGPGDVSFADGSSVADELPPDEQVLFIGVNGDAGLSWTTASGIAFNVGAGMRYFNFQATEGGYTYANVGEVDVNEDFVWFANVGLSFTF